MSKRVDIDTAIGMIRDGDVVAVSGLMLIATPRELYVGIGEKFNSTGHPRDLTIVAASGNGNSKDQGLYDISYDGLVTRYITGHFANNSRMVELVTQNRLQCYNYPQGVITHIYRALAGGKPGEITRIGLNTFCDPRFGGGKLNEVTKEDLVHVIDVLGQEQLLYTVPTLNIGLIRGTTADELGNISMEEEIAPIDVQDIALAVKAQGGKVIAQVKNYVTAGSLTRRQVVVPGCLVDAIVVSEKPLESHRQTPGNYYNPVLAGYYRQNDIGFASIPLNERKIIARRAAMELTPGALVNLGIGIPEGVAAVASEEGIADQITLTVETGLIGGVPIGGNDFGAAVNAWATLPIASQFDLYNGGNLKMSCLGFAEVDEEGNINVNRIGNKIMGCGGFIDISQPTKKIVFAGTMTTGGLEVEINDGRLIIKKEGRMKKFIKKTEQITFNASYSRKLEQEIYYVTERCVFRIGDRGLELTEIAPGIDMEKDVLAQMDFMPAISPDLKLMNSRIFDDGKMGLREMIFS